MDHSDKQVQRLWHELEQNLGYQFDDLSLLAEAMTHRSYANECQAEALADNERLEFLGDAVLDLVISEYLMKSLPDAPEGELTRIRANVVSMPCLAALARTLEIGACLRFGRGEGRSGGRDKDNLLADALEALLGAIFTDSDFESCRSVILALFIPLLQQDVSLEVQDFKSRLQEYLQAVQHDVPLYKLCRTTGPAHERVYHVEVLIDGQSYGAGHGRTKKRAEQSAAQVALIRLDSDS